MIINQTPPSSSATINLNSQPESKNSQSFSQVMQAQLQTEPTSTKQNSESPKKTQQSSASVEFQEYMSKNDAEKMRLAILKEMGLSEEEFEKLPPEEQLAIEQKIMERLKQQNGVSDSGLNTETIKPLLTVIGSMNPPG